MNQAQKTSQEIKMQGLLDQFLKSRSISTNSDHHQTHLDEDTLTAFVEGRSGEREMLFAIKHLVDCTFCLHVTGDLIKLNDYFSESDTFENQISAAPAKISDVLSGLLAKVFGTNDSAVFAHQEDEGSRIEDDKENVDSETKESQETNDIKETKAKETKTEETE